MKDKKDFIKLFDLNVPVMEHFDYYALQLAKTEKFKNIEYLIGLFEEADASIDNFQNFKMKKSFEIINFIKTAGAYNDICSDNSLLDLPTNRSFTFEEGVNYVSVDIRSANWNSLKKYDTKDELGNSYSDLLLKFGLPSICTHSKYLRQFIFGNVNPKKQQKVQRNMIQDVVRQFGDAFNVECVKNDEVIFSVNEITDSVDIYNGLGISLIDQDVNDKYKIKIFSSKNVEDFRIETVYDVYGKELSKEIVGVNGQQFYIKLKQYITNESLDIRDLYFKSDGKLAIWMIDELNVSI